jgi:hypothetical protein
VVRRQTANLLLVGSIPTGASVGQRLTRLAKGRERCDRPRTARRKGPFTFLSNLTDHIAFPALTIASLYKLRWQVELLFKRIKQRLRIKAL